MPERAATLSDDQLLDALALSFPIEPVEPDASSLQQLAQAVAALSAPTPPPPKVRWWARPRRVSPAFIAGAVVGIVGAGTGLSYAVGSPLPNEVRSIARSVGLASPPTPTTTPAPSAPPVSPTINAARQAESTLDHALSASHPAAGVIWRDGSALARRLAAFGGHPGPGIAGAAASGQRLLDQACRQLDGTGQWVAFHGTTSSTDPGSSGGQCSTTGSATGGVNSGAGSASVTGTAGHGNESGRGTRTVPSTTPRLEPTSPAEHPGKGLHGGPFSSNPGGETGPSRGSPQTTPGATLTEPTSGHDPHDSSLGSPSSDQRGSLAVGHNRNPAG